MEKGPISGVEADKQGRAIFPLSLAIDFFLWVLWLLEAQENLFSSNLIKTSKQHTGKSSNNWGKNLKQIEKKTKQKPPNPKQSKLQDGQNRLPLACPPS